MRLPLDTKNSSQPISLNCRLLVELVDISGQSERAEFTLVPTKQADLKSGLLDENTFLGRTCLVTTLVRNSLTRQAIFKKCASWLCRAGKEPFLPMRLRRQEAVQKAAAHRKLPVR